MQHNSPNDPRIDTFETSSTRIHIRDDRPISAVLKELFNSFYGLIRSEIHLAKAEAKQNVKLVARHSVATIAAGALIFFGVLCLVAFAIIGLGNLLEGRYWLSSLILGVVLAGVGALVALSSIKKIKQEASLPLASSSIQQDKVLVENRVTQIRSHVNENFRRAA